MSGENISGVTSALYCESFVGGDKVAIKETTKSFLPATNESTTCPPCGSRGCEETPILPFPKRFYVEQSRVSQIKIYDRQFNNDATRKTGYGNNNSFDYFDMGLVLESVAGKNGVFQVTAFTCKTTKGKDGVDQAKCDYDKPYMSNMAHDGASSVYIIDRIKFRFANLIDAGAFPSTSVESAKSYLKVLQDLSK